MTPKRSTKKTGFHAFFQLSFESIFTRDDFVEPCSQLGLVNLQKNFFKLLLIEKPVMRETECRKPNQKIKIVTKL